jgi:hypothetical protein
VATLLPLAALLLALAVCGEPAELRPAKGVKDSPAATTAYRVPHGARSGGFVAGNTTSELVTTRHFVAEAYRCST